MTRAEHLVFCKKCTNRKMDLQQDIICKLTDRIADFQDECPDFNLDPTVKERVSDEPLAREDSIAKLSEDNLQQLKLEQNFPMGLIGGIVVGVIGAVLWGMITVATGYQIGFMAIAIGAAVGFTIRHFGKGIDIKFGITGAAIAIFSCLLGNFFSIIGFVAELEGLGFMETLTLFDYSMLLPIMGETFSPMDLFFYAIAAVEGYKFAFRQFSSKDISGLQKN